jgi:LPXTG-motif cell wall-anchored protein
MNPIIQFYIVGGIMLISLLLVVLLAKKQKS